MTRNDAKIGNMHKRQALMLIGAVILPCILMAGCANDLFSKKPRHSPLVSSKPESTGKKTAEAEKKHDADDNKSPSVPHDAQEIVVDDAEAGKTGGVRQARNEVIERSDMEGPQSAPLPTMLAQVPLSVPEVVPPPPAEGVPTLKHSAAGAVASPTDGPLITLHADNLEVRKALEMVSRQANMNILVSPGVKGTITLDLKDKTLNETLQAVSRLCGLKVTYEKEDIYVSTVEEVRRAEEDDLPIRIYRLNYTKSSDILKMITPLLSKKGKITQSPDSKTGIGSDISEMSETGSSGSTKEIDAGGNSLSSGDVIIVQDYEYVLKTIDRVIVQLDIPPTQVLIEAVIVQVKLTKNMDLGASFALLDDSRQVLGVLGNGSLINAAAGVTPAGVVTAAGKLANGFATDTNGLKFGFVGSKSTAFISALEKMGETKVLASPRIMVLNKQRAEIHLGRNLGYRDETTTQVSVSTETKFLKIGTQLRLRPYVSSDGMIRMEVHPERSTGSIDSEGIPQTFVSQVTTNVIVPDGVTIIIGGLLDDEITHDWTGLPFLSRLPWLGYLFRNTTDSTTKNELVVILTPHIVRPECPDKFNYLGKPSTLDLHKRVSQRPLAELRDGPTIYDLPKPVYPKPLYEPTAPEAAPPIPGGSSAKSLKK